MLGSERRNFKLCIPVEYLIIFLSKTSLYSQS